MKNSILILIVFIATSCATNVQEKNKIVQSINTENMKKTDAEWKEILTPEEYYILRQKGTDRAGNGGYTKHFEKGTR